MSEKVQKLLESHPHWSAVEAIYHKLNSHGYKAFLAGGCVRDALLGVPANDLDVATDATPDQIEELFTKTINVGKVFGVMRVLHEGADIEVATFRTDGSYADGRRPDDVTFSSPEEDAKRRDFTVNALFYDLSGKKVLDFVQGESDLNARILRTVGLAEQRFKEDHLRLLRAARFVAQLGFKLESESFTALKKMSHAVRTVSGERIRDEMIKLLRSTSVSDGLEIMKQSGLLHHLFPFREGQNDWKTGFSANEDWQFLSLFLRNAKAEELKEAITLLRLSTKEQRAIQRSWEVWQNPESFMSQRWGVQIQSLAETGNTWALEVLLKEKHALSQQIQSLLTEWNAWDQALPAPLLSGEDVKDKLKGKSIGLCLNEAYWLQLERKLADRPAALVWLADYLKKELHG